MKKNLFVLMFATIICTASPLLAMNEEEKTVLPKTRERNKSSEAIFQFSGECSSSYSRESSSHSQEQAVDELEANEEPSSNNEQEKKKIENAQSNSIKSNSVSIGSAKETSSKSIDSMFSYKSF